MTYLEYRRFGFVSKLGHLRCGGGPSNSTIATQQALTGQQLQLAQTEQTAAAEDRAQRQTLMQPLIAKESALATGDRQTALAAAMPTISKISGGYDAAKASIFNSLPAGAARDKALASLETQKATGVATAQAEQVASAPEILANVGSGVGAFSLQELGAALSGYSGASSSNAQLGQMQTAQSQAKWAPIMGLAGAAGTAVSGTKLWGK